MNTPLNYILEEAKKRNQGNKAAQEAIMAIQNGDSVRGEEIANSILQQNNIDRDTALSMAKNFFNLR